MRVARGRVRITRVAQDAYAVVAPARAAAESALSATLAAGATVDDVVDVLVGCASAAVRACAGTVLGHPVRAIAAAVARSGTAADVTTRLAAPADEAPIEVFAGARALSAYAPYVRRAESLRLRLPRGCTLEGISCVDGSSGVCASVPHVAAAGGGATFTAAVSGSYSIRAVASDGTRLLQRLALLVDVPCPAPGITVGGRRAGPGACAALARGETLCVVPPDWSAHGGGVGLVTASRGAAAAALAVQCAGASLGDGVHVIVVTAALPGVCRLPVREWCRKM